MSLGVAANVEALRRFGFGIRLNSGNDEKKRVWFMDQYKHPQEIKHTIDEVLNWFDQTGFEFVNGLPKVTPLGRFSEFESLFAGAKRRYHPSPWQYSKS